MNLQLSKVGEENLLSWAIQEYEFLCDEISAFQHEIVDIRREDREDTL
jgi:hypothetical protein